MTLEEALNSLQPPPGHNTLLSKEAIDVVCAAARSASPLASAVAQDGVTDEMIERAEKAWDAADKAFWRFRSHAVAGDCDRVCMRAALTVAIGPLLAEKARWVKWAKELSDRTDRAEADANRLAAERDEAVKALLTLDKVSRGASVPPDDYGRVYSLIAEHDKAQAERTSL